MRIVLTGGGTAGHINPALALAERLEADGHEVCYAGTPAGVEARLVPQAGIAFFPFEGAGFDRERPWTIASSTVKLYASSLRARSWMKKMRPDVVVCFGGYVSIPVGFAASRLGIPVVVHEQNSVMGMANRFLAKRARKVALTYAVTEKDVRPGTAVVTGNPVRSSVVTSTRAQGREMLGVPEDATLLVVFGGSLGAQHVNEAVCRLKERLLAVDDLFVVHVAGTGNYEETACALNLDDAEKERWKLFAYQDRMPEVLAAADAVLSRAGATSLAEIAAIGVPALLVPFPYAAEDHQTINARSYVESGAARMIADADIDGEEFAARLLELVCDEGLRASMREAARGAGARNAAVALANVVYSVVGVSGAAS